MPLPGGVLTCYVSVCMLLTASIFFSGIVGKQADSMADAMFEGLADFVEKEKPQYLTSVKFTIYQTNMMQLFINTLKAKVEDRNKPSIWSRLVKFWPWGRCSCKGQSL